ncbi:Alpha/Beta hydrolase protein [Elsinoe ampelina]|uniref:Alpha/Beta hydrolase protein n=1 Tax=Elsinoe ampelina TaxID=302913 RepID=A0A6A6G5P7_9PEZI|nr:Alpha/Beta hydrolase protein [Elsinoe ampelina]
MSLVINGRIASFDGEMLKCSHSSQVVACDMAVNVYLPSGVAPAVSSIPVLIAGPASQPKTAVVYPGTSPKNPWNKGYRMYTGLPQLDLTRLSLTGMCVGGHEAMMLARRLFAHFFGEEAKDKWKEHDSTELVKSWKRKLGLVDRPCSEDHFDRQGQLLLDNFAAAVKATGVEGKIRSRKHAGHTHSYYFMSTFAREHVDYAADALLSQQKSLV